MNKPRTIIIDIIPHELSRRLAEKRLEELESLVKTFGGLVVVKVIQKKSMRTYKTFIGKGKLEELTKLATEENADLLIVNNILKPGQVYNLEEAFKEYFKENKLECELKVWDRVDLILKIFEKHAHTTEAKLQVKLASLRHFGPRIFGLGESLMQQVGGIGVRSGQGESNIELMKRHLRRQEQSVLEKLKHYDLVKKGHRDRRKKNDLKTIAIIGYTNAGKSALLNAMTAKKVYSADELFATLDTTTGKIYIPGDSSDGVYRPGKQFLLSDTIGFIRDLPPSLIEAFKSTLAETLESDIILHVIDLTDPEFELKIDIVEEIVAELGMSDKKKIYVFNKIDLLDYTDLIPPPPKDERFQGILPAGVHTAKLLGWHNYDNPDCPDTKELVSRLSEKYAKFSPVFVSAEKFLNLDKLLEKIVEKL
ncbi:MAG: GTPase HflX [Candidatus Gracilibacteria bacterium]|jgi:GTP-binding protein HflX|nr:GTPase HflX [Candidatus Gracilibacteria bacterium]